MNTRSHAPRLVDVVSADRPRPHGSRGYALIIVLGISMILAIGVGTMLSYLAAAEKTSGRQRLNREAYYVCDGLGRVVSRATVDVLADSSRFSEGDDLDVVLRNEVETHLGPDLADVLPAGYTLEDGSESFGYRDVDADESFGTVGLGRFTGLTGQRRTFTYDLALKKAGASSCKTTATVDTMRIPFGELSLFSDESLRICPSWRAEDVTRAARYHINGDLNVGNVTLPRITMTGDLTTECSDGGKDSRVKFCVGDFCIGSGSKKSELRNTGGLTTLLFSDKARGTSALTLSVTGRKAQHGVRIDDNTVTGPETTNENNFRFLIDPGFTSDSASVKAMKLAHASHIRIIDGVWYVKDGSWPGKAIWSDHPSNYKILAAAVPEEFAIVASARDVGQRDIYPTGALPNRYSAVDGDGAGVISYGQLKRTSSAGVIPAVWAPDGAGSDAATRAISAARRGFLDMHDRRDFADRAIASSGNVLPLNFDMSAFINAALDETGSELGAQLKAAGHEGERDLLVWIGSTWTGSLKGLIDSEPRPTRAPSLVVDTANDPLPYPMCQSGVTATSERACPIARRPNAVRVINAGAALPNMRITIASSLPMYVLGSVDREPAASTGRPSPVLPRNNFSDPAELTYNMDDGPDVFFAADSVTLLSDDWVDSLRPWLAADGSGTTTAVERSGSALSAIPGYNASFLIGRTINGPPDGTTPTGAKEPYGLERSVRFLEHWSGVNHSPLVTGSILLGFRSVYAVAPVCYGTAVLDAKCQTDSAWRHFWSEKLATTGGQPPGMPAFSLRAQGETLPDSMKLDLSAFLSRIFAGFGLSLPSFP